LPLPEREVRVLERQGAQARRGAGRERPVELGQLAGEDPHRPAVGDDVVHGEEQHVLARGEVEQRGAQQRPAAEVEGA
jgi:hypothetical protein